MAVLAADDVSPVGMAKVAAILVKQGEPIAFGTNTYKTDPLAARFCKNEHALGCHAEITAIKNARRHRYSYDEISSCALYVARTKLIRIRHGVFRTSWGLAKPCKGCVKAIRHFNIADVYYTTDETGIFEYATY
jgi:tRNA(Arg) A34 adenosine deaminase TadA